MATRRARSSGPAAELSDDESGEPSASADEDDDSSEPGQEASDTGEASEPIPVAGEAFVSHLCCALCPCTVNVSAYSAWLGWPGLQVPPAVLPCLRCTHQPLAPTVLNACMATADGSSDEDLEGENGEIEARTKEDVEAYAIEDPEEAPKAEAVPAVKEDAGAMPADISLNRPGAKTPVTVPTNVLGMFHFIWLQAHRQESQFQS